MLELQSVDNLVIFGTMVGLEVIANGCRNAVHVLVSVPFTACHGNVREKAYNKHSIKTHEHNLQLMYLLLGR